MAVLAKEHRTARGRLDSDHDPEEEWREEDQGHRRCDNIKSALRVRRCWFATRKAAPAADLISASSHVTYRSRRNKLLRLPDRRDVILDRMRCSCRRHQFRSRLNVASTTTLNCSDVVAYLQFGIAIFVRTNAFTHIAQRRIRLWTNTLRFCLEEMGRENGKFAHCTHDSSVSLMCKSKCALHAKCLMSLVTAFASRIACVMVKITNSVSL